MTGDEIDDDEYVANLLKQDAQRTAKQYKLVGMDAFRSNRPRTGAPKPNTRFLRHIIRETDSHNTALLAKEAEESRARLKRLEKGKGELSRGEGRLTPPAVTEDERPTRKRKRFHYDEEAGSRGKPRKEERSHNVDERTRSRRDRDRDSDRHRHTMRREYSDEDQFESKSKHSRHTGSHDRPSKRKRPEQRLYSSRPGREEVARQDKYRQRRSVSAGSQSHVSEHSTDHRHQSKERWHRHKEGGRYRDRSKKGSPRRHRRRRKKSPNSQSRSPSPPEDRRHISSRRRHRSRSREAYASPTRDKKIASSAEAQGDESDSDPLEAIVGPLPPPPPEPVRTRGRGAHRANTTAMDARFSSTYEPANDVHLPSDVEDDWGDALESLRDRQRWKQQGAERLKAAGFTEDQVKKWEKGGEKTEEDVRWAAKGQGREWDRGKVMNEDGHVEVRAEWGRLT